MHSTLLPARLPQPTNNLINGLQWLGIGQSIQVDDLRLEAPLAYFVDGLSRAHSDEPAAIDFALDIARRPQIPGLGELPYWPRYDGLSPGQRRQYVEWLAAGRQTMPPELGYLFLFIYGLERRALSDEADQKIVFDETMRLRNVYASSGQTRSGSFNSYTTSFLWFLVARFPGVFSLKRLQRLMENCPSLAEDHLAAALCWFASTETLLPDWAAYHLADDLPQSQRSVVAKRVPEELRRLFCKRYREQFGDGMELQVSKRDRLYTYRPANAALPHMEFRGSNPLGLSRQLVVLTDTWNQCLAELKKLSSVVGKEGQEELTIAAWEAMPADLRGAVDHPLTGAFCQVVNATANDSGHSILTAAPLADVMGWPTAEKYSLAQSRKLCETAGYIGYVLEPDACLTGKAYRAEDCLAVFLCTADQEPDPVRYNAAACMMRVGIAVAATDGKVHADELALLTQQIQTTFDLNDLELRRLEALRALLLSQPVDLSGISRLIKGLSPPQREAMGKLVLALVAADGVITPEELRAVRVCYVSMGFEKAQIEQTLRSLEPQADEPVTVQQAKPAEAGEAIPSPPVAPPRSLKLDRAAIAAIMRDTQEVAQMLAAAMNSGATGEVESEEPASAGPLPPLADGAALPPPVRQDVLNAVAAPATIQTTDCILPQRYAAFYQLLVAKSEWTTKEADAVARQHGQMLGGAIEALNEWAIERYGNQLFIEDGDLLIVDKQIMN